MSLQVDPKLWRSAKVSGEPERGIGSDGAATKHDIIDTRARYFDDLRQGVNTDLHGLQEIITQNFTGMNWRKPPTIGYVRKGARPASKSSRLMLIVLPFVVVHNFNFPCCTVAPLEAEPPLIVNADAMLTASIAVQGFEAVAWRDLKVIELFAVPSGFLAFVVALEAIGVPNFPHSVCREACRESRQ